jgi:hypothetical protein
MITRVWNVLHLAAPLVIARDECLTELEAGFVDEITG